MDDEEFVELCINKLIEYDIRQSAPSEADLAANRDSRLGEAEESCGRLSKSHAATMPPAGQQDAETKTTCQQPRAGQPVRAAPSTTMTRRAVAFTISSAAALVVGFVLGSIFSDSKMSGPQVVIGSAIPVPLSLLGQQGNVQVSSDGVFQIEENHFRIRIQSPRRGFATTVFFSAGRTVVWPRDGQPEQVVSETLDELGPYGPIHGSATVLVVITERAATAEIAKAVNAIGGAIDMDRVLDAVRNALQGHRWVICSAFTIRTME